ncbi:MULTISPECIES: hypothetical protein [Geomicrobium]|uniref:Uncharacterized protein n=1 Tax=Geomicrobium sediminis TaxID=1347788 RepID=A0ABS2P910_9BACL|nr:MULTISPECIES: hypothetical protein [Geomicrobium]MBM7631897.1 hypothetical protein [Geomicrobium sediminis]
MVAVESMGKAKSKKQARRKKLTGKLKQSIRDYLRRHPVPRYE